MQWTPGLDLGIGQVLNHNKVSDATDVLLEGWRLGEKNKEMVKEKGKGRG